MEAYNNVLYNQDTYLRYKCRYNFHQYQHRQHTYHNHLYQEDIRLCHYNFVHLSPWHILLCMNICRRKYFLTIQRLLTSQIITGNQLQELTSATSRLYKTRKDSFTNSQKVSIHTGRSQQCFHTYVHKVDLPDIHSHRSMSDHHRLNQLGKYHR